MKQSCALAVALVITGCSCHLDNLLDASSSFDAFTSQLSFTTGPKDIVAGSPITPAPVIAVVDTLGKPLTTFSDDVTLSLAQNSAGGKLLGTTRVGAVNGVATFSGVSVDKASSGYRLVVTARGAASDTSDAFAVKPGQASQLAFTVQPSAALESAAFAPAVEVTATDSWGNKVPTYTGSITLSIGQNMGVRAKGRLLGTAGVNAASGVARFTNVAIDQSGHGYTLKAAFGSSAPVGESAPFDITTRAATRLTFGTVPTSAAPGKTISPAVTVTATDDNAMPATSFVGTVTIFLAVNPGGSALSGTLTVAAVNGVATFADLSLDRVATGYKLGATASGLAGATSGAFNVVPVATRLVFASQPQSTSRNTTLFPPVLVAAVDDAGTLITGYTGAITVSIAANPGNASLSGTRTLNAVNGLASFSDLKLNKTGNGFTLAASASGLAGATSAAFDIR